MAASREREGWRTTSELPLEVGARARDLLARALARNAVEARMRAGVRRQRDAFNGKLSKFLPVEDGTDRVRIADLVDQPLELRLRLVVGRGVDHCRDLAVRSLTLGPCRQREVTGGCH